MQLSERIGRRIKLQDLHVLMTVVQAGSMRKAAGHLNTSQPNISKSIADLERALGVRLLDRHRQGVETTAYGRALLSGGAAVFDELRQTVKNIEFLADPAAGEVRIGATTALAAGYTPAVIDRLARRYSRITFQIATGFTETLLEKLRERDLDLVIARKFGRIDDERVDFEFLFDDVCVVAAGARSPWARRRNIAAAELVDEPWVLPPPGTGIVSVALEALFGTGGVKTPRTVVVIDSPQARMNLLATGRYLTIFAESTLRFPTKRFECKVLPVELPTRFPIGIFTLKHRTLNPVAHLFIDSAREIAMSLVKRG
jgi:DNA-binding transcriptional LysR family regulator